MIAEESDPNSNCHTEDLCALLDQLCDSSICFFKGAKQIYNYWSLFNYPTERDWNIFVAIEISLKFDPEPETCDQMSIHIGIDKDRQRERIGSLYEKEAYRSARSIQERLTIDHGKTPES